MSCLCRSKRGGAAAVTPETGADGALTGGSAAATAVGATEGVSETGFAADSLDACTGYAAGAKETGCSALVLLVLVEASNDARSRRIGDRRRRGRRCGSNRSRSREQALLGLMQGIE